MLSFVDDLLDLRQLRDNVFSLVSEEFNPNVILDDLINIFKPQADSKRLFMVWSVDRSLRAPSSDINQSKID